jgi:hypothetical protein
MSCAGNQNCTCGCCAGASVETPQLIDNSPGLSQIAYRVGDWSAFKASMLARLSSSDYPALHPLMTRDDDDFAIAFLDATAVVLDILTFYQERLANESYLRTATQQRSLIELSRLIGYQPSPGVAASVYLAFTLKEAPGLPANPSAPPIVIPAGAQAQSVPAQGQKPQIFETSADILAKPEWSALAVQTGLPWQVQGATGVYLAGTSTQLKLGDALLILGSGRESWPGGPTPSEQWDVVVLDRVETDKSRNLTFVAWEQPNARPIPHETGKDGIITSGSSTTTSPKIFALRQKAALFGHNAPNPNLFVSATDPYETSIPDLINDGRISIWSFAQIDKSKPLDLNLVLGLPSQTWQWRSFSLQSFGAIDLDATYQKIVVDSWFALVGKQSDGVYAQLYKATSVSTVSRADFALSAKVTELSADYQGSHTNAYPLRGTEALAQSEQLEIAETPLSYPLYGAAVSLEEVRPDLAFVKVIAISGRRQKVVIRDGVTGLTFTPDSDPNSPTPLFPGDALTITDPKPLPNLDGSASASGQMPDWSEDDAFRTLFVEDAKGRTGVVADVMLIQLALASSDKSDPIVSECAFVKSVDSLTDPKHTTINLTLPLAHCYDRFTTSVNANVGLATHGQSVSEILGSGQSSAPNQHFVLKQAPLTFVEAATPTGRATSLDVKVNGVDWEERESLYKAGPAERVYATLNGVGGASDVLFGDGVEGPRLPTGQNNVHAHYRIGLGRAGNVGAGAITTLVDRPLGVSGVTNPAPAAGGQDAQSVDDIRANAPLTVLTLGRAVSILDYQNFAASFAGVAKAHAIWIPSGTARGVFLTVAGVDGAVFPAGSQTLAKLVEALHDFGNPLIPIAVQSYVETLFGFSADLQYDPAYDQKSVEANVRSALASAFSFEARNFGQAVSIDEIAATIQAVAGVIAVNVTGLRRTVSSTGGDVSDPGAYVTRFRLARWRIIPFPIFWPPLDPPTRLCARLPVADFREPLQPAEILALDPTPGAVTLGAMS